MSHNVGVVSNDCWTVIRGFCSSTGALAQTCTTLHHLTPQPTIRISDHVGSVTSLKWLLEVGVDKRKVCAPIANLEVLKYAREQGCPLDERSFDLATAKSNLEVLKWLREQGCPWGYYTCARAAWTGNLEVLKWLREQGCPWGDWVCQYARLGGHRDVLRWALANGASDF